MVRQKCSGIRRSYLGRKLGNKHFDAAMNEAKRFIANEADFMKEQTVW